MTEKIVVTNATALKRKYGKAYADVRAAVTRWIAADNARGVSTRLVAVDAAAAMKRYHGKPVTDAAHPRQNKEAIDAVFGTARPDYLVILGAVDVIPHQDLTNPLYSSDDPDRYSLGDLPYACESPYSRRINDFIGPTRVIGRLPDLTGATKPDYLIKLIDTAARWQRLAREKYERPLAITAGVWEGSTRLTLRNLFRTSTSVRISPPRGPKWRTADVARLTHLINCHGAQVSPEFYGQQGNSYPVSHQASHIAGKITRGTVVAVECCYGAELYDPNLLPNSQAGIANVYLLGGAYGYFGSTTIAYGDVDTNSAADLLCQYFLAGVLNGASLGRAALEAQQRFARLGTTLDPVDLKTLAQFVLLGDPSIHPVQASTNGAPMKKAAGVFSLQGDDLRHDRRVSLLRKGLSIPQTQGTAVRAKKATSSKVMAQLRQEARKRSLTPADVLSFGVEQPVVQAIAARKSLRKATLDAPASYHVLFSRKARAKAVQAPVVLLVAKEVDGEIVSLRELHRR
ncbi:MAG: hypothetical protein WEE89_07085 [Gemmatimonadota bacterium]